MFNHYFTVTVLLQTEQFFYINICCFITASDISKVETDDLQVHDHVHFAVIYLLLFAITYKRIIAYFVSNLQPILS